MVRTGVQFDEQVNYNRNYHFYNYKMVNNVYSERNNYGMAKPRNARRGRQYFQQNLNPSNSSCYTDLRQYLDDKKRRQRFYRTPHFDLRSVIDKKNASQQVNRKYYGKNEHHHAKYESLTITIRVNPNERTVYDKIVDEIIEEDRQDFEFFKQACSKNNSSGVIKMIYRDERMETELKTLEDGVEKIKIASEDIASEKCNEIEQVDLVLNASIIEFNKLSEIENAEVKRDRNEFKMKNHFLKSNRYHPYPQRISLTD